MISFIGSQVRSTEIIKNGQVVQYQSLNFSRDIEMKTKKLSQK